MSTSPTVVSLFCGCGGSSLGYKASGFNVLAAVDFNAKAVAAYRENVGAHVTQADITGLSAADLRKSLGLDVGELDVLDGSPPCQGFSTAKTTQRSKDDPRNSMWQHFARFLREFRPRAFVVENVPAMTQRIMLPVYAAMIGGLRACGYTTSSRILDAAHYGIPQRRKRLIVVGIRDDVSFMPPLHPAPSVLVPVVLHRAVVGVDVVGPTIASYLRDTWSRTVHGKSFADAWEAVHGKRAYYNAWRLHWSRVCPTMCKTAQSSGWAGFTHPDVPAMISIAAAQRICSFPDDFRTDGTYEDRWALFGNAVPPKLMAAIAARLRESVFVRQP